MFQNMLLPFLNTFYNNKTKENIKKLTLTFANPLETDDP